MIYLQCMKAKNIEYIPKIEERECFSMNIAVIIIPYLYLHLTFHCKWKTTRQFEIEPSFFTCVFHKIHGMLILKILVLVSPPCLKTFLMHIMHAYMSFLNLLLWTVGIGRICLSSELQVVLSKEQTSEDIDVKYRIRNIGTRRTHHSWLCI